jgi:hypothetical protein
LKSSDKTVFIGSLLYIFLQGLKRKEKSCGSGPPPSSPRPSHPSPWASDGEEQALRERCF